MKPTRYKIFRRRGRAFSVCKEDRVWVHVKTFKELELAKKHLQRLEEANTFEDGLKRYQFKLEG